MSRSTHDTQANLSGSAEPEQVYKPGFFPGTDIDVPSPPAGVVDTVDSDISKKATKTLADYLGRLSTGDIAHQPNRRINKSNTFAIDTELHAVPAGSKEPIKTNTEGALSNIKNSGATIGSFIDVARQANSDQANRFEKTSTSNYGHESTSFSPFTEGNPPLIDKSSGRDGHTLLTTIEARKNKNSAVGAPNVYSAAEVLDTTEAQKRISFVLENNRFNPYEKTPFMRDHARVSEDGGTRMGVTKQGEIGRYIKDAAFILEEDLKKVGPELITAATGQDDLRNAIKPDGSIDWSNLASLTRLTGWDSVNAGKMKAARTPASEDILSPSAGVKTSLLTGEGNDDKRNSYGTLNSPLEPFSSPLPVSMVVNTVLGAIALIGASAILGPLFALLYDEKDEGAIPVNTPPNKMTPGRHSMLNDRVKPRLRKLFHAPEIQYGARDCLIRGILTFYGFPKMPSLFPEPKAPGLAEIANPGAIATFNVLDFFGNLSQTAGYYSVITRAAIRDTKQIAGSVNKIKNLDFASATVQSLSFVESIVESTSYKFLMTMMVLGDRVIASEVGPPAEGKETPVSEVVWDPNNKEYDPKVVIKHNRSATGELTWRNKTAPSRFYLPAKLIKAAERAKKAVRVKGEKEFERLEDVQYLGEKRHRRLDPEEVKIFENRLNAEWMPFYFQDIRTNDYIAFHAFLTSLDDSYQADYTSTSAYGRGDDIRIYSKTTRSIVLKFIVAATSENDLSEMYWKINRLVALVYPQWSRGRAVISGEGANATKFIQPFSQIPTASPLVRLRVADVLTSNYSKFNLMRLFGIGEDESVFNLHKDITKRVPDEASVRNVEEDYNRALKEWTIRKAYAFVDPGATDAEQVQQFAYEILNSGYNDEQMIASFKPEDNTACGFKLGDIVCIHPSHGAGNKGYFPRDSEGRLRIGTRISKTKVERTSGELARLDAELKKSVIDEKKQLTEEGNDPNIVQDDYAGADPNDFYKTVVTRSRGPVDRLVDYTGAGIGFDFRIIGRIADSYSPKPQNEKNFEDHVANAGNIGGEFGIAEDINESKLSNLSSDERAKSFYGTMAYLIEVLPGSAADRYLDALKVDKAYRYHRVLHGQITNLFKDIRKGKAAEIDVVTKTGDDRIREFFDPENNFIVRGFESTMGRGLAGFVTSIGIDWKLNDSTWEINPGSRAPKLVEINMNFAPIHDIPMGLDSSGAMRSLPYNVGKQSNTLAGDPIDDISDSDFKTNMKNLREEVNKISEK